MATMDATPYSAAARRLALLAREQFTQGLIAGLPAITKALDAFLTDLMNQTATQREMQRRRDVWLALRAHQEAWVQQTTQAWRAALHPAAAPERMPSRPASLDGLTLLDDRVVENRIAASRMALPVLEQAGASFEAVRQRTQRLEGAELVASDVLRPEAWCLALVDAWHQAGLSADGLALLLDPLQRELAALALQQYQELVKFYDTRGVQAPSADELRARVRRPSTPSASQMATLAGHPVRPSTGPSTGPGPVTQPSVLAGITRPQALGVAGAPGHYLGAGIYPAHAAGLSGPLLRARQRAQGVMAQLRRLLGQPALGLPTAGQALSTAAGPLAAPASAALAQALVTQRMQAESYYGNLVTLVHEAAPMAMARVATVARERTQELKSKADTPAEKAIIEVVALMFQAILSEERIPPAVRVWFARLQVPVLRVALADPGFFSNLAHPARQLIDRMGSCALGFDANSINGSALEAEIRRIVQVIEQYPETGQRVFAIAHDEFEAFLARFLTERQGSTARIASVAQQVEQRETLTIQYTIELRALLKDMPVREEIRDFLFKTWAEVLAVSAVRQGAQHASTVAYKRAAADLVWAASAKPQRADRAQVIQSLPALLQALRQGLALLGVTGEAQDAQIKVLTDTLADAFLSKTAVIPQAHIDAMARRLAHLEDYLSDEALGDMPLSVENIELLLGIDASSIDVIADNGAPVEADMLAWAQQLAPGAWFTLDHNSRSAQVQYIWHSQRRQLHLFAASDGRSYLLQLRRLAAYLQAGLLVPQEEESLTLRATREALTKLDANPERLLG